LSQAAAKAPANASYHYDLALAYLSADKRAQARAELERTISIAPESAQAADARRALLALSPSTTN
jgi:Tfp pilus assembly protein PilF